MRYFHIPHPSFPAGSIVFNMDTWSFEFGDENVFRYFKGACPKRSRMESMVKWMKEDETSRKISEHLLKGYDHAKPFSYKEAFQLEDEMVRAVVFGSINISEMIEEMGCERICVNNIRVKQKMFAPSGEFSGWHERDNIYELHKVNGSTLGINKGLFVVKCWCTSTNKEHWIWVEEQYTNDALTAIASTFRVHENIIPYIKVIKRQGDILILEMKQQVKPQGNVVPLTKEQYFGLLTVES